MKISKLILISSAFVLTMNCAMAEKGHDHSTDGKSESHENIDHKDHDHKEAGHAEEEAGHKEHQDHKDHDGHEGEGGKAVGKGKAIIEINDKYGFKLSPEAIKTLSLKLDTVNGEEFEIKKETLVTSKAISGIYRFKNGFFKLLPAEIKKETKDGYLVFVKNIVFGDQIVTNGVGLLKVADVYASDKSNYGHAH